MSRCTADVDGVNVMDMALPTASAMPAPSSDGRVPWLAIRRPDSGAKIAPMAASGSRYNPATSGESPRTSCR